MSKTPMLSELREPAVVGSYYLVPVVRHRWFNRLADWPVIGPMHTDRDFFAFPDKHYHIDHRFLTDATAKWVRSKAFWRSRTGDDDGDLALICSGYPLAETPLYGKLPTGRPNFARRRCHRPHIATPLLRKMPEEMRTAFRDHYGDRGSTAALAAPAIKLADGRRLCPHRKVDLSSLPADGEGVVTCPLHGLKVCVR